MQGSALAEENITIHLWLFNISSTLIDPVMFCISQKHAIAPLTQQVVDHMLDRMVYYSQEILTADKTIVDRFKSLWLFFFFFSRERLCTSNYTESCVFIVLQSHSDPTHSVYREICSDYHLLDSESQDCRF